MINLCDANLHKILPPSLRNNPDVLAFCGAVDNQIRKIIKYCQKIEIWSNIREIEEDIADYLATELRTQFYDKNLPLETKRNLVANTLIWYEKAGTNETLEEVIQHVFGSGEIKEWYEYGGRSPYFKVVTSNKDITGDQAEVFADLLESVKRKTAKLETVITSIETSTHQHTGIGIHETTNISYFIEGE